MSHNQAPARIDAYQLNSDWDTSREVEINGHPRWVPARPLGLDSLRSRFKLAMDVFKGKADALYWRGQ